MAKDKVICKVGDTVKVYLTGDTEESRGSTPDALYFVGTVYRLAEDYPLILLTNKERVRYDWYLEKKEVKVMHNKYEQLQFIKRRKNLANH